MKKYHLHRLTITKNLTMQCSINYYIFTYTIKVCYSARNSFNDKRLLSEVCLGLVSFNSVRRFDVT